MAWKDVNDGGRKGGEREREREREGMSKFSDIFPKLIYIASFPLFSFLLFFFLLPHNLLSPLSLFPQKPYFYLYVYAFIYVFIYIFAYITREKKGDKVEKGWGGEEG